jgi:acetyl esterase/lipase
MDQFKAQANAVAAAGTPVETLVVDGEGHGFYKPEHRETLYTRLAAFLDKYIGPQAQSPVHLRPRRNRRGRRHGARLRTCA